MIYTEWERRTADGTPYATLRVSDSTDAAGTTRVHVREWVPLKSDPSTLLPTRGIALTDEELDWTIYALSLAREARKQRTLQHVYEAKLTAAVGD